MPRARKQLCSQRSLCITLHGHLFNSVVKTNSSADKERAKPFHSHKAISVCLSFLCPCSIQKISELYISFRPSWNSCRCPKWRHRSLSPRWPSSLPLNVPYRINKKQHHGENRWLRFHWKTALITYTLENVYGVLVKAQFCTDEGILTNKDAHEPWGLIKSLKLPEASSPSL